MLADFHLLITYLDEPRETDTVMIIPYNYLYDYRAFVIETQVR